MVKETKKEKVNTKEEMQKKTKNSKKINKKTFSRYITVATYLPILIIAMIFANNLIMDAIIAIISFVALREYYLSFKRQNKANPISIYGYLICVLICFIHFVPEELTFYSIIITVAFSIFILFALMIILREKYNAKDVIVTLFGIIYIPISLIFFSLLRGIDCNTYGKYVVALVYFAAWGSDSFAYLVGKAIGKHKLTPISPKKSWEGSIAGVLGAVILGVVYKLILEMFIPFRITYLVIVLSMIALSVIGQIGDLAASAIKRYVGIKDFSDLLPGHGGMLDRFDSVIMVAPFAYFIFSIL